MSDSRLTPVQLEQADLADWRPILQALHTRFRTADFEVRNDDADLPAIWFQGSGAEEPRQRFHIDVRLPPEVVQERIEAAVAAGGQVVDEPPRSSCWPTPTATRCASAAAIGGE